MSGSALDDARRRRAARGVASAVTVRIGSVELSNPVMTASGTAGYGTELAAYMDLAALGAVVVKSLAAYEWAGNPAPRLHPTAQGMLNAVGLQGPGIPYWLDHVLPDLLRTGATVVASIWGRSRDDYAAAADLLAAAPAEVVAVELNLSCPNLEGRNAIFAHDAELSAAVVAATAGCGRPRWAKLSANTDRIVDVAGAVSDGRCRGRDLHQHAARAGLRPDDAATRARRRRRRAVRAGDPPGGGAGGPRRARRTSRTCRSSASAGSAPAGTRPSCCSPGPRPSRSARRRSPTPARRCGCSAALRG